MALNLLAAEHTLLSLLTEVEEGATALLAALEPWARGYAGATAMPAPGGGAPLERLPSALLTGLAAGVGSRLLLDPLDGFVLPPFAWLGLAVASALALAVMERGADK